MPTLRERKTDVSIIIPVYNLESFIYPILKTLGEQDLNGYTAEIIFVLNNCTDRSEEIIRGSGLDCIVVNCETQGCGPARNMGFEIAHGEYIWFMDGDDWLLSNHAVYDAIDKAKREHLDILRIPFKSDSFGIPFFSMVWQYVLRKEFVEEFRFPNYQPAEDEAYMEQVLAKAGYNRITYLSMPHLGRPQYFYRYKRLGSNMYRHLELGEKI